MERYQQWAIAQDAPITWKDNQPSLEICPSESSRARMVRIHEAFQAKIGCTLDLDQSVCDKGGQR